MKKIIFLSQSSSEGGSEAKSEMALWTVSGNVTENWGSHYPIPGVSIVWKGTQVSTQTDQYGNYVIKVEDQATAVLVYSALSFESQEQTVGNRATINVSLNFAPEE
jgi:phosphatidate phosphatase APP1